MGLDGRKHRRNLNVLICGGSGAGKTRFYAKPNIMQANTSFVILDPKGELLRDTGHLLEEKGYVIKVLDLINPERSHCYNPFVYLRDDDDIVTPDDVKGIFQCRAETLQQCSHTAFQQWSAEQCQPDHRENAADIENTVLPGQLIVHGQTSFLAFSLGHQ